MLRVRNNPFLTFFSRYISDCVTKEYSCAQNGVLNILLPFKTVIKTLNVHDVMKPEKVVIKCTEPVICSRVNNSCNISMLSNEYLKDVVCEIFAPMQSSINASCSGDVTICDFIGDAVRAFSEHGDVILGNCKSEHVLGTTKNGTVFTQGTIDAGRVVLKALDKGNIDVNKLKCLGLHIETASGNVNLESSYCDESYFVTKTGILNLKNVHKNTKVLIEKEGQLNMIGFNGILDIKMTNGTADVQISELKDRSYITITEKASLTLHLSDELLKNTEVEITSNCCEVNDKIPHLENEAQDLTKITPTDLGHPSKLIVRAPEAMVVVKKASWKDMIERTFSQAREAEQEVEAALSGGGAHSSAK